MKEEPMFPLTALSEVQRAQALERYTIIHPVLEDGVSQAQMARTHGLSPSTIQRWLKQYWEKGLVGLANHVARSDKGKARSVPEQAVQLIEGLTLQTPPRSAASLHRQIVSIATEQGWKPQEINELHMVTKEVVAVDSVLLQRK